MPTVFVLATIVLAPTAASGQYFGSKPNSASASELERRLDMAVSRAKALTQGNMGEAGIGFCAGVATGFACKQVQNMVVNSMIFCAGAAGIACLTGQAKPDELLKRAEAMGETAKVAAAKRLNGLNGYLQQLDMNGDGTVDRTDADVAKITLSKFAQEHAGLMGGLAGGLYVGYRVG